MLKLFFRSILYMLFGNLAIPCFLNFEKHAMINDPPINFRLLVDNSSQVTDVVEESLMHESYATCSLPFASLFHELFLKHQTEGAQVWKVFVGSVFKQHAG